MNESLVSNVLNFLEKEKIKMKLQKTSDLEFWLESQDGFVVTKFIVNQETSEVTYDVFSPKYDVHLREETLRDVEKLDFIAEEARKWEYEKSIEDLWLVLDCVKIWARKNGFHVKETRLI
jgi:hypothetical protein